MATTLNSNNIDNRSGGFAGDIYYVGNAGDGTVYAASTNGSNDTLDGAGGNDYLNGGSGNDSVDGGTGNDTLVGGTGNDVYIFDSFGDQLTELANQGNDTLTIDATNTMGASIALSLEQLTAVENLDISRTGTQSIDIKGNALANVLTGNDADNYMEGLAGNDTLLGGLGNDFLDGGVGADVMNGGDGDDIYLVNNISDVIIDSVGLNEVRSTISYSIAGNSTLDNLVLLGTANINATGNDINNLLLGNDGNNILDGGAGDDDMEGGKGNDTYLWRDAGDSFFEVANAGTDTLKVVSNLGFSAGDDVTLTLTSNVEHLDASQSSGVNFDLAGNDSANILTGNDANNGLNGGVGNDTLFGGAGHDDLIGGAGVDSLVGGIGNDNYEVNLKTTGVAGTATAVASLEDIIVESALITGGIDAVVLTGSANLIKASTIILAAGLENLYAEGTGSTKLNLTGNAAANDITGNDANNIILGLGGSDTLVAGAGDDTLNGGVGADVLSGGDGNDTYISELVLITVAPGQTKAGTLDSYVTDTSGIDTIKYSGAVNAVNFETFDLSQLTGYENIDISATGATKLNLTGNDADNTLTGNLANNILTGGAGDDTLIGGAGRDSLSGGADNDSLDGGLGIDTMEGGLGDDVYLVDMIGNVVTGIGGDITTELADEGNDTVITKFTSSLTSAQFANIENLTLTGVAAINATGNAVANTLTGNDGANILDGGLGADTLSGGKGNDTYVVNESGDLVIELLSIAQGGGVDLVKSAITFTLSATNLENLTLTDGSANGGAASIDGTGNQFKNVITGNAGNNILIGGLENDTLFGGDGADQLDGGRDNDSMVGGNGDDIYTVDSFKDIVVESNAVAAVGGTDIVNVAIEIVQGIYTLGKNIENATLTNSVVFSLIGNGLNNVLTGNNFANFIDGGAGADTIHGGNGTGSSLFGGDGNDSVIGGTGVDTIEGGAGNDALDGGSGAVGNWLSYFNSKAAVTVDLSNTSAQNTMGAGTDTLLNFANLYGSKLGDDLTGNSANNIIQGYIGNDVVAGGLGNDILTGDAGNDQLFGEDGNDELRGGVGSDTLDGGAGIDNVNYIGSTAGVKVSLSLVVAQNTIGEGTDTLINLENVYGSNFKDVLTGNNEANVLSGVAGNDTLFGGAGDDTLIGGVGADVMTGGAGADIFDFNVTTEILKGAGNYDSIMDFSHSDGDKIDLSTIDANILTAGNGSFNYIGNAAFVVGAANAGQLRIDSEGFLSGDTNGDGVSDFEIAIVGISSLVAEDFIL